MISRALPLDMDKWAFPSSHLVVEKFNSGASSGFRGFREELTKSRRNNETDSGKNGKWSGTEGDEDC